MGFIYLFIVGQIFGLCIFLGYSGLKDPTFLAKKKKSQMARQAHIEHVVQNSASIRRAVNLEVSAIKYINHGSES